MIQPSAARGLLVAYGLMGALAYATLLPLWEGYDEPYHYAYVQHLARTGTFPVLDQTLVGCEVWQSMALVPGSHLQARSDPRVVPYPQFLALHAGEKERRMEALRGLAAQCDQSSGGDNYEAQQAPLAYLLLTPLEASVGRWPLFPRIWLLRAVGATVSLALFGYAFAALARRMALPGLYSQAALFCLLSTQSLYGGVAHVANDWLALPLILVLLLATTRFWQRPTRRSALGLAGVLAAGLLAKSYFLVYVPFAIVLVAWRERRQVWMLLAVLALVAAPWYARNLTLYHSLTGLQASVRAVPKAGIWATALSTHWPEALAGMARGGLWSANSSFTTFSAFTLNAVLVLLVAGCLLWFRTRSSSPPHAIVLTGTVLFAAIPIYAMLLFGTMFGQVHPGANSWYTVGMLPGLLLVAFAGFAATPRVGRWLARALVALSCYIVAATYFAKLIPLYAGFDGPARVSALRSLYLERPGDLVGRLGETTMAAGELVLLLAAGVVVLSAVVAAGLWRQLNGAGGAR